MTTSDTPRTDEAEAEYKGWCEYSDRYGHLPEAMEQAPENGDPFAISRYLERENNALQSQLAEKDALLNDYSAGINLVLRIFQPAGNPPPGGLLEGLRYTLGSVQTTLAERDAALAVCVTEFEDMAEMLRKDGRFQATVEAIVEFIATVPESAKQAAKVLEAAEEVADGWDVEYKWPKPSPVAFHDRLKKLCQAIREMK